jgi:hypothetical protein
MIVDYLESNGYSGLVNQEIPCGCLIADLAPCGGECMNLEECDAGYVHYCDDCSPTNREECTVEDCPSVGGYCVGPTKEITHYVDPPPELWITDAKLQDTVELYYGDVKDEQKMVGVVKAIAPNHYILHCAVEGHAKLVEVDTNNFIRIVKLSSPAPKEKP